MKLAEIAPNFARFRPQIFGRVPKFWKVDYKIVYTSDHVAKFHRDRPRELGDLALKIKKTSVAVHKTAGNYRSGRPNKTATRSLSLAQG